MSLDQDVHSVDQDDDRDRLASLADCLTKRETFRRSAAKPAESAPVLQARVQIPDSAQDRRQWLKQQSKSRRRKRRSSTGGTRAGAAAPQDGRGRRSTTRSEEGSFSRDSSVGSDASDASSVLSNLSIVSTPEISQRHRQVPGQQQQQSRKSFGSPGRASFGRASKGMSTAAASAAPAAAAAAATRGKLPRDTSLPSLSAAVSTSLSLRWCGVCEAEFTRLRRPHRCRRCLEAVCAPCSPARLPVPGTGSHELKRTCKLCAGDAAEPRTDAVVSRAKGVAAAADASGSTWRSGSVGSMTRAPIEMLSGVAAAVTRKVGNADGDGEASLRSRLAAGGMAALGAVGAGIGLSSETPSGDANGRVPDASDTLSGPDGKPASSTGGDAAGVERSGASVASRFAAGGMAALGAVGAGISLSSEKPPAGMNGSVSGTSGAPSGSVDRPADRSGASVTSRLAAGGMAALGAVGAGIGLSGEKPPGDVDGSAADASGTPSGTVDIPAGSAGGDTAGVERDGASVTSRLAAGGLAALGKIGTGLSGDKPWREVGASILSAGGLSADAGGSTQAPGEEVGTEEAPASSLEEQQPGSTCADSAHQRDVAGETEGANVAPVDQPDSGSPDEPSAAAIAATAAEAVQPVLASSAMASETVAVPDAEPVEPVSGAIETGNHERASEEPVDRPAPASIVAVVETPSAVQEKEGPTELAPVADVVVDKPASFGAVAPVQDAEPDAAPTPAETLASGVREMDGSVARATEDSGLSAKSWGDGPPTVAVAEKGQEETRSASAQGAVVESAIAAAAAAAAAAALEDEEAEAMAALAPAAAKSGTTERDLVLPVASTGGAPVAPPPPPPPPSGTPTTNNVDDIDAPHATGGEPPAQEELAPPSGLDPTRGGFPTAVPSRNGEDSAESTTGDEEAYVEKPSRPEEKQPGIEEGPRNTGTGPPTALDEDEKDDGGDFGGAGTCLLTETAGHWSASVEDGAESAVVVAAAAAAPATPSADGSLSDGLSSGDNSSAAAPGENYDEGDDSLSEEPGDGAESPAGSEEGVSTPGAPSAGVKDTKKTRFSLKRLSKSRRRSRPFEVELTPVDTPEGTPSAKVDARLSAPRREVDGSIPQMGDLAAAIGGEEDGDVAATAAQNAQNSSPGDAKKAKKTKFGLKMPSTLKRGKFAEDPSAVDSMRTPSMNLEARGLVPPGEIDTSVSPFDTKEDDSAVKALKKGKRGRFGGLSFRKSPSKATVEEPQGLQPPMTDSRGLRPGGSSELEPAADLSVPVFSSSMSDAVLLPGASGESSMPLDEEMSAVSAEGGRDHLAAGLVAGGAVGGSGGGASSDRPPRGVSDPLSLGRVRDSPAVVVEAFEAGGAGKEEAVSAVVPIVGGRAGGDAVEATAVRVESVEELAPRNAASKYGTPAPGPSSPEVPGSGAAAAAAAAAVAAAAVPGVPPESASVALEQGRKVRESYQQVTFQGEVETTDSVSASLATDAKDPLPTYEAIASELDEEDVPAAENLPPPAYHEIVAEDDAAAAAAAIAAHAALGADGYASSTCSAAAAAEHGEEGAASSAEAAVRSAQASSAAGSVATVASGPQDNLNQEAFEQGLDARLPPASAAGNVVAKAPANAPAEVVAGSVEGAAAAAATSRTRPAIAGEVPQAEGVLQSTAVSPAGASLSVLEVGGPAADGAAAPAREPAAALPASASAAGPAASARTVDAAGSGKAPQQSARDSLPEAAEQNPACVEGPMARHDAGESRQPGAVLMAEGGSATEKGNGSAVKWFWLMPDGETNSAASLVFFVLFFAFVFCLRSLDA